MKGWLPLGQILANWLKREKKKGLGFGPWGVDLGVVEPPP
jgi:hypothetical protein